MKSTNVLSACLVMSMIACSQQRQASENSAHRAQPGQQSPVNSQDDPHRRVEHGVSITEAVAKSFKRTQGARDGRRIRHRRWDEEFCRSLEITGASRRSRAKRSKCAEQGIEFIEYRLPTTASLWCFTKEQWAQNLTVADLKKIWEPEAQDKIKTWTSPPNGRTSRSTCSGPVLTPGPMITSPRRSLYGARLR